MNKGKQAKQVIILAALLLALIIAVCTQFMGGNKAQSASPAPAADAAKTNTATALATDASKDTSDLNWVSPQLMTFVVGNVASGRDPFVDHLAPAAETSGMPSRPTSPIGIITTPPVRSIPEQLDTSMGRKQRVPDPVESYVPPPVPAFVLSGIISTPSERFASISVDGHYYTLLEGETIPKMGWTVAAIRATSVVLVNKSQKIIIPLPGGSPK